MVQVDGDAGDSRVLCPGSAPWVPLARRAWATTAFRTLHLLRATPEEVAAALPQLARTVGSDDVSAVLQPLLRASGIQRPAQSSATVAAELTTGLPAVEWHAPPREAPAVESAAEERSRAASEARELVDVLATSAHAAILDSVSAGGAAWRPLPVAEASASPDVRLLHGLAFVDALGPCVLQQGVHAAAQQVRARVARS